MIKTIFATACALSLTAGVAFAQSNSPAARKTSDGNTMPASSSVTTQSGSADSVNGSPAGSASTGTTAASMPATSMPAAPTVTANTPTGDAPSAYPFCTKKGQDRCKQRHAM